MLQIVEAVASTLGEREDVTLSIPGAQLTLGAGLGGASLAARVEEAFAARLVVPAAPAAGILYGSSFSIHSGGLPSCAFRMVDALGRPTARMSGAQELVSEPSGSAFISCYL